MSCGRSLSRDSITGKSTTAKARIIKNLTRNWLFFKPVPSGVAMSEQFNGIKKHTSKISWDYPFKLGNLFMLIRVYSMMYRYLSETIGNSEAHRQWEAIGGPGIQTRKNCKASFLSLCMTHNLCCGSGSGRIWIWTWICIRTSGTWSESGLLGPDPEMDVWDLIQFQI
jgi:hypothetical protein